VRRRSFRHRGSLPRQHDAERFGRALEDPVQASDVIGDDYRGHEREEHGEPATIGDELRVHATLVRRGDER